MLKPVCRFLLSCGFFTFSVVRAESTTPVSARPTPAMTEAGTRTMNGIQMNDYRGFEKNWRLVTVRFRKDTQELRWTFANELAWKTLASGLIEYPPGAVFAKIGTVTHEDSQFPSSAVPSGARRYQFMVRDAVKYKETGGWGYALFDVDGNTFPDPVKETSMACYACHRIVENRGQVFSQPFLFSSDSKALIETNFVSDRKGFRVIEFEWVKSSALPIKLRSEIPTNFSRVRTVTDANLKKHVFHGTLDEIRPRLELEAYKQAAPAVLVSSDGKSFSLVTPIEKSDCKKNRSFRAVSTLAGGKLQSNEYCNP